MDKKSDTRLLASGAAPGLSPSARFAAYVAPPIAPDAPAAPAVAPLPPVEPDRPEGPVEEAIFRPTLNEAGELVINILPPTLYNLTHPKEEDDVSQGNRHYRTLDPVDDILRRKLERTRPGAGVFSELMIYWPDPTLEPSCPDVCVVFGLKRPPEEIENSFNVAKEGVVPCLVFEIVSATYKSTRDKDYEFNPQHYARAGVKELVLVEPVIRGSPEIRRIRALKLDVAGTSQEIKPDATGRILLETVGFHVHVEKAAVVLEDARTGERFLTSWEEEEARKAETAARRDAEHRAADEA
ncbi:MAG: Uma2 family endonuclease, partial [bacterium]|nr:Uma2 family endonuclease [bacterium]